MTAAYIASATSFFVCLLAIVALRPVAVAVDLVDRPGGRKTHHGEIPIVGGVAMFLGLAVGLGLAPAAVGAQEAFISACALLVTTGLIDDRFDLSPWVRLPAQAAATLMVIASVESQHVLTFGDPFGTGAIVLEGLSAYIVTIVFVVGAINAFNMLDGMDGLAGAVSLVALSAFAYLSSTGASATLQISMTLGGAVAAFLVFNLPIRMNRELRCFMGDAGSTLIGFVLALISLRLTQASSPAALPVEILWFVALPIYELLWTIIRRGLRGQSPFSADREHFHHLLLDAGFSVRGAFVAYVVIAAGFAAFGLGLARAGVAESTIFALFVACGVFTVLGMYRARWLVLAVPTPLSWGLRRERRQDVKSAGPRLP